MKHLFLRAGLLYALVIITGMFSLAYVPQTLIHFNDPELTVRNLQSHTFLFRLSLVSSALCYLCFLFLVLQLYSLFADQHPGLSRTMALLALISVPMSVLNLQHKYAVLELLQQYTGPPGMLSSSVMEKLKTYHLGLKIVTIFWGLWLLPLGMLVWQSPHFPRLLGVLLMGGCAGYLINFLGSTLYYQYADLGFSTYLGFLPGLAEISTCGFLLYKGLRMRS